MRAGYEATKEYEKKGLYTHINALGENLRTGLREVVEDLRINAHITGCGSMTKLHLLTDRIDQSNLGSLRIHADGNAEKKYFHHLISRGIFAMAPTQVHFYVSLPHLDRQVERTVSVTEDFLKSLGRGADA